MEKTRCPYCHEYVDNDLLAAHTEKHRALRPDGQQQDYATLPFEDRFHSDLKGVPVAYVHKDCGVATQMPEEIVRSYLQNPYLYLADTTFCAQCGKQVPYSSCVWSETGENLQQYFDALRAAKPEYRPAGYRGGSSQQTVATKGDGNTFSAMRIVLGLAAVFFVVILTKLPRALIKNAAEQADQMPNNQLAQEPEPDQWGEKIKRGEDVPEPILMLAGIKPQDYRLHQFQLRLRELGRKKQFEDSAKTFDEALLELPDSKFLHNGKAWLLATCADDKIRNGKVAVEHATKACELSEFSDPSYLDTLAAAEAEAEDFESAVKHITTAMEVTEDEAQRQRFAARLELYKNHQPFRD